jgi:DNA processing protein
MSSQADRPRAQGACRTCRRRSWLLEQLSGPLECCARDRRRLLELLALADDQLLAAVAGRRARELRAAYERFGAIEQPSRREGTAEAICRHRRGFPRALTGPASPPMLEVAGGARRLATLTAAPVVAIAGTTAASDYGMQMARSLARGLSACGVTVAAGLTDGIAVAAHAGALDARGAGIAVMGGGLGVSCPARRRSLYERVTRDGCAVSELPWSCDGRRWGQLASERIVVALSQLVVLVEADDTASDLMPARIARSLTRSLAAVPGRVTSPLSRGTHALLIDGASLVRGPQDVLELLHAAGSTRAGEPAAHAGMTGAGESAAPWPSSAPALYARLESSLRTTMERVGRGCDTPDKLARAGHDPADVLLALSELELLGLLVRGDGGRYVPREPLPMCRSSPPMDMTKDPSSQ